MSKILKNKLSYTPVMFSGNMIIEEILADLDFDVLLQLKSA